MRSSRGSNIDFAPTLLDLAGIFHDAKAFDGRSFAPALRGEKMPARPLFFELGYVRGVVKDGWKYIALRYPESARAMAPKRRKTVLDAFNEEQNKKGRPIHNRDPMSPFSHVLQIPGGDPATNTAPTFASDPIFKSDANVGAAYTGSVVPSAATTLALDFTMSPAVTAATDIALAGIVVKVVP